MIAAKDASTDCIAMTSPASAAAAWFALAAARSPLPPVLAVGRPEVCGESMRTINELALDLRYHCRPRCHSVLIAVLELVVPAGTSSSSDEVEADASSSEEAGGAIGRARV